MTINKKIILKNTPVGVPEKTDFEIAESSLPEIGENEMMTKTIHLSLDHYIRGVIAGRHIYSEKVNIGDTIVGRTCLLYTSPSPRDKRQSRMPSSA